MKKLYFFFYRFLWNQFDKELAKFMSIFLLFSFISFAILFLTNCFVYLFSLLENIYLSAIFYVVLNIIFSFLMLKIFNKKLRAFIDAYSFKYGLKKKWYDNLIIFVLLFTLGLVIILKKNMA